MLKNYIQDENTSADTKEWLNDLTSYKGSQRTNKQSDPTVIRSGMDRTYTVTMSREMSEDEKKKRMVIASCMSSIDTDALQSWNFDVTHYSFEELIGGLCLMFEDLGLAVFMEDFDRSEALVPLEVLWEFIHHVKGYYHDVPYHNFFHCCDVAHATFRFIKLIHERTSMSSLERFALMIAAVCHDMDHPGLQNSFLVETNNALATIYNDRSVLENRHVSCLYTLVSDHNEANVFQFLDKDSWRDVRKIIIEAILHTDMVKHFGMVSRMEIFYELHASEIHADCGTKLFDDPDDRHFLFALILHSADVSNPVRPLNISEKWADNVLNEFFRQGDAERQHGLKVSPLCDRDTTSRPGSQINFLEFVIAPLYFHVVRIFPEMQLLMMHLKENRLFWEKVFIEELEMKKLQNCEEEKAKAKKRLDAFLHKYKEVFELKQSFCSGKQTPQD